MNLKQYLYEALQGSLERTADADKGSKCISLNTSEFFDKWFRGRTDQSLIFLFKKNAKVTNIQFAELLALIRTNLLSNPKGITSKNIQFLTTAEFKSALSEMVETFSLDSHNKDIIANNISNNYYELLERTVVLDCFYGTCAVFLPPNLNLIPRLSAVCALSGYIHSCGRNIYLRKVDKTDPENFIKMLKKRVDGDFKKVLFSVYSDEDFTKFDRSLEDELKDGLDNLKIHVEKFYMGSKKLVEIVEKVKRIDWMVVPEPGDYKKRKEEMNVLQDIDRTQCIWLIIDYSIDPVNCTKGDERYYVCYQQMYKNENPFHIFDENKPAWSDHVTIPHTLMGAMINITKPWWPKKAVKVCDPFVGSGTTIFEALKHENILVDGFDINPLAKLLYSDNKEFFNLDAYGLKKMRVFIQRASEDGLFVQDRRRNSLKTGNKTSNISEEHSYKNVCIWAKQCASKIINCLDNHGEKIDPKLIQELRTKQLNERVIFYLALRALRRNSGGIIRGSENLSGAFKRQSVKLNLQINEWIKCKSLFECSSSKNMVMKTEKLLRKTDGLYSTGVYFGMDNSERENIETRSVKYLPVNKYNLIVADPPYGFNTSGDVYQLSVLYKMALEKMLLALKDNGQLVLCLLDKTFTGRHSLYFARKEFIIHQVHEICKKNKRKILGPSDIVPYSRIFKPPYYWESEKALRRAILHFQISVD